MVLLLRFLNQRASHHPMNLRFFLDCKLRSAIFGSAIAVFGGAVTASVVSGATYDLSSQFSLSSNPNGVWSYGWSPTIGGTFTSITSKQATVVSSGVLIQSWSLTPSLSPAVYHNGGTNT